ncbi:MAG TPA: PP2C family protein-serine/threonine phosphatase [Vicinamibacteria bacterium]|nr:PP2C family protein-serine/threonine phosphatase [Vicinamibacteria bacterium]
MASCSLGGLAFIAVYFVSSPLRWISLALMLLGFVMFTAVQVILRREFLCRLDREEDQRTAREIQSRLLPALLPGIPGIELAAHYTPFRLIGGDYYDALPLGNSHLFIAMADVSGKGTGAALLTANLQATLHFALFLTRDHSLEAVAHAMNAQLAHHTAPNVFVTMVLAVLDLSAYRLRYVNAGHAPPLGLGPDGNLLRLEATGLPLGIFETSTYAVGEVEVPPGTALLLYTDGLSERADPSQRLYGEERIAAVLRQTAGKGAEQVIDAITSDAERFAGGEQPHDDTALLVLRTLT